jgi:carbon monoxide dehydrogenase subunit G
MEVSGEYTFDAPQEMVWEALQDPQVLGSVMPGGEGFEEVGENEYAGKMKIKVGPVQGLFKGNIRLRDVVAPESYHMEVDGRGAPGFVNASGRLQLTGDGEKTHMVYEGEARVGGRIASVGQRLLEASARSIIRQSLEGLNEYLQAQMVAEDGGEATEEPEGEEGGGWARREAASHYEPPSQAQVALNVAKDVARDLAPADYDLVFAALAGVIVGFLLGRLSRL